MPVLSPPSAPTDPLVPLVGGVVPVNLPAPRSKVGPPRRGELSAAGDADGDEEEELGDEEDLSVAQPLADEDSTFDDFVEVENDPDWDHPDEGDAPPPPGKAPGRKK